MKKSNKKKMMIFTMKTHAPNKGFGKYGIC